MKWGPKLAAIMILASVSGISAWAAKHPVPLDPNTDSAKCLECHADKTKGASVHSAMQMGCLSCHEIRIIKAHDKKHEDVTRVKLIKATPLSLCLTCHDGMNGKPGSSKPHAPVTKNCLLCHDPHNSPNKDQLLKPTSGDKDGNLCLKCHTQGLNVPKKGSRHAALDMGCDTCHTTHKIGPPDKRDNKFHLTKDAPALCLDCHDPKDEGLKKAHHGQPFAQADCLSCHDPHQSQKPKLAQYFQHNPFESGSCEVCHEAPADGKVVLTQKDVRSLCVTCHDKQAKEIETAKVPHPGAQGDCTVCHSPHASAYDRLLRPDPVSVCENCHADFAEMHKNKPVLHAAAFRDGCFTCHDGHGGDRTNLLRAEGNALCLQCHSPNPQFKVDKDTGVVTIFGGAVRLPGDYFTRMPALDLRSGDTMGHPTSLHPVTAAIDRGDPDKKRAMGCTSCHLPHAGEGPGMFVTNTALTAPLCNRCHTGTIGVPTEPVAPAKPAQPTDKKKKKKQQQGQQTQ